MTRITLLFSIFCWLTFPAHAQVEFAPIGAEWVFNSAVLAPGFGDDPLKGWVSYKCTGDSTIGNQTYRQVGTLLFRQQDYKVYLYHNGVDYLLYDYGLEVGDTTLLYHPICFSPNFDNTNNDIYEGIYIVHSVTTIPVGSQSLKKFKFIGYDDPSPSPVPAYEYTEKLGNSEWLIGECYLLGIYVPAWLRCYKDSVVDYKSERWLSYNISDCYYLPPSSVEQTDGDWTGIKFAPNPVDEHLTIDFGDQVVTNLSIVNFSGQIIYQKSGNLSGTIQIGTKTWPKGVYFCSAKRGSQWVQMKIVK